VYVWIVLNGWETRLGACGCRPPTLTRAPKSPPFPGFPSCFRSAAGTSNEAIGHNEDGDEDGSALDEIEIELDSDGADDAVPRRGAE